MDLHHSAELNIAIPVNKNIAMEEGSQSKSTAANVETVEDEQQL